MTTDSQSNCDREFVDALLEAAIADTDGSESEVVAYLSALVQAFGAAAANNVAAAAIGLAMTSSRIVAG